jgi:tetratricopeptide (TPR) repeat protein
MILAMVPCRLQSGSTVAPRVRAPGKLMMQDARSAAPSRKKTSPPATVSGGQSSAGTGSFFQHYQSAVQLLQQGRYEKARAALQNLLPTAPAEFRERVQMYLTTCQRQLEGHILSFQTPEEHYDYAVSLINTGYYEEAREQLDSILVDHPDADYAYYGLALLDSISGRTQECLGNLARAIELNPRNRLQARSDSDFQSMADDPRFTELLYPEVP